MNRSFVFPGQMSRIFFKVDIQVLCIQPEFLEAVKFTRFFFEHVDDHVSVIDQHPMSVAEAFDADRPLPGKEKIPFNSLADCPDLGGAFAGADNEEICNDSEPGKIENDRGKRFFLQRGPCCLYRDVFAFEQTSTSCSGLTSLIPQRPPGRMARGVREYNLLKII